MLTLREGHFRQPPHSLPGPQLILMLTCFHRTQLDQRPKSFKKEWQGALTRSHQVEATLNR